MRNIGWMITTCGLLIALAIVTVQLARTASSPRAWPTVQPQPRPQDTDPEVRPAVAAKPIAERPAATRKPYRRSEAAYSIPAVQLVDRYGDEHSFTHLMEGDGPCLMQFVFTSCPTICPVMAQTFGEVQQRLQDRADLTLISVSIDPEHDTPVRLQQFASTFSAGPNWRFLTGSRRDIIAIQQAFEAYTQNKMWHDPLTFLRAGPQEHWVRLDGLVGADDIVAELGRLCDPPSAQAGDAKLGRLIYEEGRLPSGELLRARTHGELAVSGQHLKCANCHRPSGYASSELEVYVPPVTAAALFQPRDPQRAELFREMFQEYRPKAALARIHDPRMRPAYTDTTLADALRRGNDPTGRPFDLLMPRYQLEETDLLHLIAYLKTLDTQPPPGVSDLEIHFATVVTPGADPSKVQAMQDVIDAYVRRKNADTHHKQQRPGFSLWYKDDFSHAYRKWVVHPWHLNNSPETWPAQLEQLYADQPVFAMLSGLGEQSWQPIHDFCEQTRTPCLFPHADLPVADAESSYTLYLSKALLLEAEVLGASIRRQAAPAQPGKMVQIYRADPRGNQVAQAFRASLPTEAQEGLVDIAIPIEQNSADLNLGPLLVKSSHPQALILWLNADDVAAVAELLPPSSRGPLYLSTTLLESQMPDALAARTNVFAPYLYELPGQQPPRIFRVRAWMRSRRISRQHEPIQLNTFFALTAVDHALTHLIENYSQDYLIESIEHETENLLNPGIYPHLSLGPGQRFASKGGRLVRFSLDGQLSAVTDWIVPGN